MTVETEVEIVDDAGGLVLRRVVVGPLATNCWIVAGALDRRAVIVDPGDEPQRIIDACADFDVRAIVLTHTHWDHVLALPDVADAFRTDVLAHPDDGSVWAYECEHLTDTATSMPVPPPTGSWAPASTSALHTTGSSGRAKRLTSTTAKPSPWATT